MKGTCGYCKSPDSKYIPIDANMLDLIKDLRYQCSNKCGKVLKGFNLDVDRHMNIECNLKDETKKWSPNDKILCCGKTALKDMPIGHLCNPK